MTADPGGPRALAPAALSELVAARRAAGAHVVFTNGVFDLLHLGHAQYLRRARALGDLLVVGLNSDGSTRRLKGPQRPLVPQEERAALLAALAVVDAVTIFESDTASPLLDQLRPEWYVKGADYAADGASASREYLVEPEDVRRLAAGAAPRDPALAPLAGLAARLPETPTVAAYGGALALLAYLPGHSTSDLIQRIVSRYTPAAPDAR
ncbi:MAG TPA: adenylyltransferase/cytidyltransferase family protein [Ktedonobacterales bacterium]